MARIAASMVLLSLVFWCTSAPPISFGKDFPNCVSARWENPVFVTGALSVNGKNCLFVDTRGYREGRKPSWTERPDGHFCGFSVPPYERGVEPRGLTIMATSSGLAVHLPYWLITLLWAGTFAKYFHRWQFRVGDLLLLMTGSAAIALAIKTRHMLPYVVFINIATALLLLLLAILSIRWFVQSINPLWPLALPDSPEPREQTD